MRTIFVISDMHLGHEKAALARGFSSVEEHDEELISRWNNKVKRSDIVYNLGDVIFQPATKLYLLDRLICHRHHLIIGNHEHHDIKRYVSFFNKILLMLPFKEQFLFTHVPIHRNQLEGRFEGLINVHGHIHEGEPQLYDELYCNVNCEFTNYEPLSIEELKTWV